MSSAVQAFVDLPAELNAAGGCDGPVVSRVYGVPTLAVERVFLVRERQQMRDAVEAARVKSLQVLAGRMSDDSDSVFYRRRSMAADVAPPTVGLRLKPSAIARERATLLAQMRPPAGETAADYLADIGELGSLQPDDELVRLKVLTASKRHTEQLRRQEKAVDYALEKLAPAAEGEFQRSVRTSQPIRGMVFKRALWEGMKAVKALLDRECGWALPGELLVPVSWLAELEYERVEAAVKESLSTT
jgi:hypothetical protein